MAAPLSIRLLPTLRTKEEAEETYRIIGNLNTWARMLGISRPGLRDRLHELGVNWSTSHTPGDHRRREDAFDDEAITKQREIIRARLWPKERTGVLLMADPHCPEVCMPLVRAAIKIGRRRFTRCSWMTGVIGDSSQSEAYGPFDKRRQLGWRREYANLQAFVKYLAHESPWVFFCEGNHDQRILRVIARAGIKDPEALEFLRERHDIMRDIHGMAPNVLAHRGWWLRIANQLVCAHPDRYRGTVMGTGAAVARWYKSREHLFPGVDTFVLGHTHGWGQAKRFGVHFIECGCLAWESDYTTGRKLSSNIEDAWHRGCVTLFLLPDGSIEPDSIILHDLDHVFEALAGSVMSAIWAEPPPDLLAEPIWPEL